MHREMYHSECYHCNFPTPMSTINGFNIFVNDFVIFYHNILGDIVGKVVKYFMKVILIMQ